MLGPGVGRGVPVCQTRPPGPALHASLVVIICASGLAGEHLGHFLMNAQSKTHVVMASVLLPAILYQGAVPCSDLFISKGAATAIG